MVTTIFATGLAGNIDILPAPAERRRSRRSVSPSVRAPHLGGRPTDTGWATVSELSCSRARHWQPPLPPSPAGTPVYSARGLALPCYGLH